MLYILLVFLLVIASNHGEDLQNDNNKTEITIRAQEGRKKKEGDMMSKVLPMMIIPFMVSTGMVPMMLVSLKIMLLQSMFLGKIAILLMLINMFRSRSEGQGGVTNHNVHERDMAIPMAHYGYNGGDEYGAYVN